MSYIIPNKYNVLKVDFGLFSVLVNTFWKEGKIDEAVLAVQGMEKRGIVGSAALYYDLARCLCSAGRCQEALMQVIVYSFAHLMFSCLL